MHEAVLVEEQEEVLAGLGQEEGRHAVFQSHALHVGDGREPALGLGKLLQGLQKQLACHQPRPVSGGAVVVVGALDDLRPQWVQSIHGSLAQLPLSVVDLLREETQVGPHRVEGVELLGAGVRVPEQGLDTRPEGIQTLHPLA